MDNNNGPTSNQINGQTGNTYNPGSSNTSGTTYYHAVVTDAAGCTSSPAYTNEAAISVDGKIVPGAISANQDIGYNTSPATITCEEATGADGNFTYQWECTASLSAGPSVIQGAKALSLSPGNLTQTTYYRVAVTSASCGTAYSGWCEVYVYGILEPGQLTGNQTICNGTVVPEAMNCEAPSGGSGNPAYQWQYSTDDANFFDIAGINAVSYTPSAALTKTTYYRVKITDGSSAVYTNIVTITVLPLLSAGNAGYSQTICNNFSPTAFSLYNKPAGGSGSYSYQWQSSTDNLNNDFQPCPGLGNNTTSFTSDPLQSTTYFRCLITDNYCTTGAYLNVYTNSFMVTVLEALNEGTETSQSQTICYDAVPSAMSVSAATGGKGTSSYTYQWQSCTDNFSFGDILGATGTTYTPANELTQTTYYRRSVTSGSCGTAYSPSVTVTVLPELIAAQITGDQTICYGTTPPQPVSVAVAPTGGNGNYTYAWLESTNGGVTWSNIAGSVQDSYQPAVLNKTTVYEVVVTSGTCGSSTSGPATIIVPGPLEEATISEAQTICYNSAPQQLTGPAATGGDNTYAYQWQSSHDNQTWVDISSAISETYQPGILLTDTFFRRSVTSELCGTAYSNSLKITTGAPVNAGIISSSEEICSGNTPSALKGTNPTGGSGLYSYLWQNSPDSVVFNNIDNGTNSACAPGVLTSTTYYRRIVNTSCGSDTTNVVGIYVLPSMSPGTVAADQSLCYGAIPAELSGSTPAGGNATYSYQWQWSGDNTLFVNVDSLGNTSTYIPPPATANVYYHRMAWSSSCSPAASNSVFISVLPAISPGIISANQAICYNTAPDNLTGGVSGGGTGNYIYQWYGSNAADTAWSYIPGETSLNYQPATLINTSWYKRITSSGACGSAASNIITVNVLDKVKPAVITGSQTICYNSIPGVLSDSIMPDGGTGSFSFQWQNSVDRNIWKNIANSSATVYSPGILTNDEYYRVVSENVCDTVTSDIVTLRVMPSFNGGQITGQQSICYNMAPATLFGSTAFGEDGNYTYQWQSSSDSLSWSDLFYKGSGLDYSPDSLQSTTWYRRMATSATCNADSPSNVISVRVSPAETPGNIMANEVICYNAKPGTIKGIPAGGGTGNPVYTWESSNDGINWTQIYFFGDSLNYSPDNLTDTTVYRRKVSMTGCRDLYTNSVIITVNPQVPDPLVNLDSAYCRNSMITLTESSGSKNTILWYNSNNNLINEGEAYTIDTFKNNTQLFVKALQASDNCPSYPLQLLLKLDMVHAAFTVSDADTQVIIGTGVNFSNKSVFAENYIWQFFDGDPSFDVNPWHFYNAVGKYNVQLVAESKDNCNDTAYTANLIDAVLAQGMPGYANINSAAKENQVTVFPNPVSEYLTVTRGNNEIEQLSICDLQGNIIIYKEITDTDDITVNVSFLPDGLYVLKIKTSNNMLIFKIIKI